VSQNPLDEQDLRVRIQAVLDEFVDTHRGPLDEASPDASALCDSLLDLLSGGKRLRAAFVYWGYRSNGAAHNDEIIKAAASLELLQACALIHDDVMDGSDTRRGKPAIHRHFENVHNNASWQGSSAGFGVGAAILVGDLALSWADTLLCDAGLSYEELNRAKSVYDVMRAELMAGQYLDLLEQARQNTTPTQARNVIRYKSAKYTIERPLNLGAAIANADQAHQDVLTSYGLALGEAFQLRDDLLGVFGTPEQTGKPAGDDLREGKQTVLVATAREKNSAEVNELLEQHLGDPAISAQNIVLLQEALLSTGAVDEIETQISALTHEALIALESPTIEPNAREALTQLAIMATQRNN
jgi:geranylgeranyl diphosphate synthase, type I